GRAARGRPWRIDRASDRVVGSDRPPPMIPISDENLIVRRPLATWLLLAALAVVWIYVQGAGRSAARLAETVCNLGLVAGEITGLAPVGRAIPIGPHQLCVVDAEPINWLT